jgi:hypothetical protein
MAQVGKSALEAGIGHGTTILESAGRLVQSDPQQVAMGRRARQFAKDARKVKGTHSNGSRQRGQRVIILVVLFDTLLRRIDPLRIPSQLALSKKPLRWTGFLARRVEQCGRTGFSS